MARALRIAAISFAALLAALILAPLAGSTSISISRALDGLSPEREILFLARLPRVLMAALAGMALSVAGVLFQALLRDALATPYTLGVSSGASLGAVAALVFGWPAPWAFAFAGAAAVLFLVLGVATEAKRVSPFTLLLAGVTINSMALALILFLQAIAPYGRSIAITRWLMGGIEAESYTTIAWLAVVIVPLGALAFLYSRGWNLMTAGDEWAAARGANAARLTLIGYLAGSALAGAVAAFTGPIGFVGLIVPHALRLRLGADHRVLLPASAFLGAAFLIVCDTAARTLLAPSEIPVGVVTALLGGPVFIWLLRAKRRYN
jgi:iron complex transport system permease protein